MPGDVGRPCVRLDALVWEAQLGHTQGQCRVCIRRAGAVLPKQGRRESSPIPAGRKPHDDRRAVLRGAAARSGAGAAWGQGDRLPAAPGRRRFQEQHRRHRKGDLGRRRVPVQERIRAGRCPGVAGHQGADVREGAGPGRGDDKAAGRAPETCAGHLSLLARAQSLGVVDRGPWQWSSDSLTSVQIIAPGIGSFRWITGAQCRPQEVHLRHSIQRVPFNPGSVAAGRCLPQTG
mmetsp:Transcript_13350/g.38957  ORF Transcript_13350/g.38957 Transcript_13350/m.38957 type:complete len:233 (+) Transcript_13350:818-1516(+)